MKQAIKFRHVLPPLLRALKITDCPLAAEGKYKCASHDDSTECELTVYPRNKVCCKYLYILIPILLKNLY